MDWHKKAQFGKGLDRWEDIHHGWPLYDIRFAAYTHQERFWDGLVSGGVSAIKMFPLI